MRTSLDGPVILYGNDNPQQVSNTDAGPNVDYQSNAILDSRFASLASADGATSNGGVLCWHNPVEVEALSAIPQTLSTTLVAAAQAPTIGGFFTLASANAPGVAVNIPLVPFGVAIQSAAIPIPVVALDFGFAIGTTTIAAATATTVTITGPTPGGYTGTATYGSRFFYPGQRILIPGAGNLSGSATLSTVVLATDRYAAPGIALAATGTITIANPALAVATNVGIGTADQEYGVAVKPVVKAGAARVYDPAQLLSRVLTVTASGASTGSVTIRGYDIYEQPMSNTITIAGTATATGTKAFKYVSSVQFNLGGTLTGTLAIGTSATIGLPTRTDMFEYQGLFVNNVQIVGVAGTVPTGLVYADQTPVATATTGDVRGTYTMQTVPNGVVRIVYFHQPPIAAAKVSSNIDFRGIVGVAQA
jgi:hypothetical protein